MRGGAWRGPGEAEECDTAVAGVPGWEVVLKPCRVVLLGVTGFVCLDVDAVSSNSFLEASFAAAMSSLPGRWRLSTGSAIMVSTSNILDSIIDLICNIVSLLVELSTFDSICG